MKTEPTIFLHCLSFSSFFSVFSAFLTPFSSLLEIYGVTSSTSTKKITNFDAHNNTRVNNLNLNQINPFPTADLTRLDNNNYLTRPISLAEIENIIKHLKNNAPGNSFISKLILTKLPNEAI